MLPSPAASETGLAAPRHAAPGRYRRRERETTLLHEVFRSRLEPFLAAARDRSAHGHGLPGFVERDLRAYLDCGILARGFVRIRCDGCGFERLVAFSCKSSVCPSCAARRMEDGAAHLVEKVLPAVPVRQWVLSFPRRVRFLAARNPGFARRLLDLFTRAVFAWQRRAVRRTGLADPRPGAVTAVQRFGSALNLNVHFHTLVPDGVFDLSGEGRARFVPLRPPTEEDLNAILGKIVRRTAAEVARLDGPSDEADPLAALQAAEVDRRLRFPGPWKRSRRSAYLDGFSLHAGVRVHANDRQGLEHLCRYLLRPAFALSRLSRGEDGRLVYRMKRPRDEALYLLLTPDELLARLATLVPPPRTHGVRYHGVFAPNAKGRARVVPARSEEEAPCEHDPSGEPSDAEPRARCGPGPSGPPDARRGGTPVSTTPTAPANAYRVPWAELLQKVFAVDVLECPSCGGRLRVLAFITEAATAKRILLALGETPEAPPLARAQAPPEGLDSGPDYGAADPIPAD